MHYVNAYLFRMPNSFTLLRERSRAHQLVINTSLLISPGHDIFHFLYDAYKIKRVVLLFVLKQNHEL